MLEPRWGEACLPETVPCIANRGVNGTAANREMTLGSKKDRVTLSMKLSGLVDKPRDDLFGRHPLGLGRKGGDQSVDQYRSGNILDVF